MYTGADVVKKLREQRREIEEALHGAKSAESHHGRVKSDLEQQYARAFHDLGVALLPQLDAPTLQYAVQLTGYSPFQHQDPIAERERERAAIAHELAQIESSEEFAHRELHRHPRTGTLFVRRNEIIGHRAPWAEVLDKAAHERLDRLLESNYGTDDYNVPFWRLSYYSDWEAGDQILEKFPDKKGFGEVRAEVLQARETVATFDAALLELQRQIDQGAAIEQRHTQLREALSSLDTRHLEGARKRITEHVLGIEPKWISPRLANAPEVQLLYLRASGIGAKGRYLGAMVEEHAGKLQRELTPALGKIDRDIAKFSRPKNYGAYWPSDVIDRRIKSRRERFAKQQQKFESHYTTVYVYDDWSRARGYDNFVWWYLMTDNRFHGSYIPEVATFEQQHPEWASQHAPSVDDTYDSSYDDSSAAAVIADQSRDDSSYSSVDAS